MHRGLSVHARGRNDGVAAACSGSRPREHVPIDHVSARPEPADSTGVARLTKAGPRAQYIACRFQSIRLSPSARLLRDDVFIRIRDAIVDGTFAPGEQLKDGELAAWLGVSRTPVREALLRLAHGGLVVAQPGRSTIVSTIERRAIWDARDVVAAMHELAVREAVPELTASDLDAMRDANRRFAAAIDAGDVDAALRADDDSTACPWPSAATRR